MVKYLNQSRQQDTRRKRRGAELPSQQGSSKEPVSNNRMEGEASKPPINDKELFDNVDPVSSQVPVGRGATKESVDNKKPEERVVVNSVDNEEPPVNRALEDRLVVDSVDNGGDWRCCQNFVWQADALFVDLSLTSCFCPFFFCRWEDICKDVKKIMGRWGWPEALPNFCWARGCA